jgi:HSP20 family molecular chaperone IbpA
MQVVLDPDTKVMTISGEREVDRPVDDDGDFVRVERKVGRFERRFKLPDNIDTDNITAKVLLCCCCFQAQDLHMPGQPAANA